MREERTKPWSTSPWGRERATWPSSWLQRFTSSTFVLNNVLPEVFQKCTSEVMVAILTSKEPTTSLTLLLLVYLFQYCTLERWWFVSPTIILLVEFIIVLWTDYFSLNNDILEPILLYLDSWFQMGQNRTFTLSLGSLSYYHKSITAVRNASYIYFGLLDRFKKLIKWCRMVFYVNNLEEKIK